MRRTLLLATALLAMTASIARAELKVGDAPKPFGPDAVYLNCEDFDFVRMRGKVVVLQLAHTSSKPSQKQVSKLDELLTKYAEKGLHVVVAFEEGKDAVESFVAENRVKYPVVAGVGDLRERWGLVKGFPTTYVLDVQGKVAWTGNFADLADDKIAVLLGKVTDLPFVPEKYAPIAGHMLEERFVDAREAVTKAFADKETGEDDRTRLAAILAWLDEQADAAFSAADSHREKGALYEAYKAYHEVQKTHAGSAAAERSAAAVEALVNGKETGREIEAWLFFEEQFELAAAAEKESKSKAIRLLKKVVTKYRGSAAAKKAQYWIAKLAD